ncbi:MAG: DNA-processing protein DprA [Oscillospiraceae bacterium]|nr:DNA-processing protein DprA [Oscillospiraceae bacterium]
MAGLTGAEQGFLLLTSRLGNPDRKTLSVAQLRTLASRVRILDRDPEDRDLEVRDLVAAGYGNAAAEHILRLLEETELLEYYVNKGLRAGCVPITRASSQYPAAVRKRLGLDAPGCLWARGDLSLLDTPTIALVGSRDLREPNRAFAEEVGRQAALQGITLVSGNARGADKTAQNACLAMGGRVISVVADPLIQHRVRENVLYLSEDGYEEEFSAQRALSRNRVIHALGSIALVAQATLQSGGTWDGTSRNLRFGWSGVCCFDDGSDAALVLEQMGARKILREDLSDLPALAITDINLFDQ